MNQHEIPHWMLEAARLAPHIEAALEYAGGTHTIEDVVAEIAAGNMQLWPGQDSVIVTEIVRYPRKTVLNFFLAGGKLEELEPMSAAAERWAETEHGCSSATLMGRPGWQKTFLAGRGYVPKLVYMSKELKSGKEQQTE